MRLVESSEPGAVERDNAIHLLTERAVLTRMVCFELVDIVRRRSVDRRVHTALSLLLAWVHEKMPGSVRVEPHPADGINEMTIPAGYEKLVEEIRAGAQVGEALFMYYTADTSYQADQDWASVQERLAQYWAEHRVPISTHFEVAGRTTAEPRQALDR
jgi:hypothetical protein